MTSETGVTALTNTSVRINGGLDAGTRGHALSFKSALALTGVGVAMVSTLASPAHAACTTTGGDTVTCDNVTVNGVDADVETELFALAGPDATLIIEAGAEVVDDTDSSISISPGLSNTTEAAVVTNSGLVGTTADPVGFDLGGVVDDPLSTLAFTNNATGVITGATDIDNFGGGMTYVNNGAVEGSVTSDGGFSLPDPMNQPATLVTMGTIDTTTTINNFTAVGTTQNVTIGATGSNLDDINIDDAGGTINIVIDGALGDDMNPAEIDVDATVNGDTTTDTTVLVEDTAGPAGNFVQTVTQTETVQGGTINFSGGGTVEGDVDFTGEGTAVNVNFTGSIGSTDGMGNAVNAGDLNINTEGANTSSVVVSTDAGGGGATSTQTDTSTTDASGAVSVTLTGATIVGGNSGDAIDIDSGSGGLTFVSDSIQVGLDDGGQVDLDVDTDDIDNVVSTSLVTTDGMGGTTSSSTTTTTNGGGDVSITDTNSVFTDDIFVDSGSGDITVSLTGTTLGTPTNSPEFSLDAEGSDSVVGMAMTDDGMGNTTSSTQNDFTANGGDIALTATDVTSLATLDIDTDGGAVSVSVTDTDIGDDMGFTDEGLEINNRGSSSTSSTSNTTTGMATTSNTSTGSSVSGGDIDVDLVNVTTTGDVDILNATGDADVDITGSTIGDVGSGNGVFLQVDNSTLSDASSVTDTTDDGAGNTTSMTVSSTTAVGGNITLDLTDTTVAGDIFARSGPGDVTVTLTNSSTVPEGGAAGNIVADAIATNTNSTSDSSTTTTTDMAMDVVSTVVVSNTTFSQEAVGGSSTVLIDADSEVGGGVFQTTDNSIDFENVARIKGDVFLTTARTLTTTADTMSMVTTTFTPPVTPPIPLGSPRTVDTVTSSNTVVETVGGTIDFLNSGIIGDPVLVALGDITITNAASGVILANTTATSGGDSTVSTSSFTSTLVDPGPPLPPMSMVAPSDLTFTSTTDATTTQSDTGGSITYVNEGSQGAIGIGTGGVVFPETAVNVTLNAEQTIDIT